ncbi:MAG: ABC transporter ATP-binding protein [Bacilli bacterium]
MIKSLAKCVREYKKESILTPIFITIEVLMECFMPLVTSQLINILNSSSDTVKVLGIFVIDRTNPNQLLLAIGICGIILVLMAFFSLFGGTMAAKYGAKAAAGFGKNVRKDVYYKIQDFSFANIDKFSTSSLVTRLTTDITNVQQTYGMLIRLAVRCPLMLIFAVCLSFTFHPTLPLLFLIVIPILGVGLALIFKFSHPLFVKVFHKYDSLNERVQENVRGIRVVKSYVREEYEKEKFRKSSHDVCADFTKAESIIALNNPLMVLSMYICMTVISYIGAKLIITTQNQALEIGDLTSLITYSMQILSSLMMFSFVFLMAVISSESAARIVEVLDEEPTLKNPDNPVYDVPNGSIEFKNVSFRYNEKAEKNALQDINLKIESGETIGIIGGTGSSKSSLIQLISRLYDTSEGEVLVGGHNVKEYDLDSLRNQVSVVLQKNVLFSGTIKENLRWGNKDATDEELVNACKLAQADEFISSFPDKYDTYIEQGGTNVSGGQKQRLCIARALLKNPKIIIFDDSTSAVDTKTDALIRKGLKEYIPQTTKIIIAQRIASVQEANKIIVMDNGTINQVGNHEELLKTNKIYQEVYYSQNKEQKAGDLNA